MFGWNFILIRDKDGNINAFHNICRHRGHPVTQKASGSSTVLACRFHAWSYLANGDLHTARAYTQLPDFEPKEHGLFKIHTHVTAQGFVFVNFDASETPAVSFEEQFGEDFEPMPKSGPGKEVGDEFELFPRGGWEYDHTWNSSVAGTEFNWKTFVDGFQVCSLWRMRAEGSTWLMLVVLRSAIIARLDTRRRCPKILPWISTTCDKGPVHLDIFCRRSERACQRRTSVGPTSCACRRKGGADPG